MHCTDFIFNNIRASDQNYMLCSFDGLDGTVDAGSRIEFTTFSPPDGTKFFKTHSKYNEALTFRFSLTKRPCTSKTMFFSRDEIAFCMRWLVCKEYCYLRFLEKDWENISFHCRLQLEERIIGGNVVGFDVTGTCDAPFGYGPVTTFTLTGSDKYQYIYDDSDEIGETYPKMEIMCTLGTDKNPQAIDIENGDTHTHTIINGCESGETITIGSDFQISSNKRENTILANNFNFKYFCFGNTFDNNITKVKISPNCIVTFSYRPIRKGVC